MPHLEPGTALSTLETALRQLMEHAYQDAYGGAWLTKITTEEQRQRWAGRAEEEKKRRGTRGVMTLPAAGLEYADLYALIRILDKHWQPVSDALGKRKESLTMLERFDALRNAVGHSRSLLPFEQDLLAGIAGDIRNRVTIYMSSQDPSGDYYPRIESVTDSFGNMPSNSPLATLRPGDTITFTCRGVDPQGRELEWGISTNGLTVGASGPVTRVVGAEVTLTWEVSAHDVQDSTTVIVSMRARGTDYHRHRECDEVSWFVYRVLPPHHT